MSVIAADKVVFSQGVQLRISAQHTPRVSLADMGLVGKGITVNLEQTMRKKIDAYPEVSVAEAILAQACTLETTLREWRKETLLVALGQYPTDMVQLAAGAQVITEEAFTLNSNRVGVLGARAATPPVIKFGTTVLVLGTDYNVFTDLEGRTVIVGKSAVAATNTTLTATYTTPNLGALERYKVGGRQTTKYFAVELFETLTNGGTRALYIPKAGVTVRGALDFFTDESAGDVSIRIDALQDSALEYLALLENTLAVVNDPAANQSNQFTIDPGFAATTYASDFIYDGGFASSSYAPYQVLDGGGA